MERYYWEWFEAFEAYHDSCQIKIKSFRLVDFHDTTIYRKFLLSFKAFAGFSKVIAKFEDLAYDQAEDDRVPARIIVGKRIEALRKSLGTGLEAYPWRGKQYDCGHVRYLEFHPRTKAPRELGFAPYMDAQQDW